MKRIALYFFLILIGLTHAAWAQPMIAWANGAGGTGIDQGNAIATDTAGNVLVAGDFNGSMDLDPGPGTHILTTMGVDMLVAKYAPNGSLLWAHVIGGAGVDAGTGIAADDSGNVFIAGHFEQTVDFDPGPATFNFTALGGKDFVLIKLDPNGDFVWAKQFGTIHQDLHPDIALDRFGHILLAATFSGTMDCDPGPATYNLVSTANSPDAFVVKLATDGSLIWAINWGGPGSDALEGIALDTMGNVLTTGTFDETADFDPGSGAAYLSPNGPFKDVFVSKLSATGTYEWAFAVGDANHDYGYAITCDEMDGIFVAGHFKGTVDFDPGPATANYTTSFGNQDAFILKVNSQGNFAWLQQFPNGGGYSTSTVTALVADPAGNIFFTGTYTGNLDFDPGPGTHVLISSNGYDIFLSKLDAGGALAWVGATASHISPDKAHAIARDAAGMIYLTGYYGGNADFDMGPGTYSLQTPNNFDYFVAKYGICQATDSTLVVQACSSYALNSQLYTSSGTYNQVIPNTAGCDSAITLRLTITGVPALPGSIFGDSTICESTTHTYSVTAATGALGYVWSLPGGWMGMSSTDSITTMAGLIGGTISVYAFNLCGNSDSVSIPVTVVPTPSPQFTTTTNGLTATFTNMTSGGTAWSWTFGDGGSSTLQNPVHTYAAPGNYNVSLTVIDNGCPGIITQTINIVAVGATTEAPTQIILYPNPSSGRFMIQTPAELQGALTDVHGQRIMPISLKSGSTVLDLGTYADGIYFLQMHDGVTAYCFKVVKQ